MTREDVAKMADNVFTAVSGFVRRSMDPLTTRIDGHAQKIESAERRAERLSQHISRLETRLQALERKAGK